MPAERLWNGRFIHLIAIDLTFQFGAYMVNPIISAYAVSLGASIALAGFLAGLCAIMAMVARPISGWISDRFNKKLLLLLSAAGFMVAAFGCAFSTAPSAIAFFRSLQGVAFAFRSIVIVSFTALVVPPGHIGRGVGWLSLAQTVSCAVAPMVGATIGSMVSYETSFVATGLLFVAGLVLIAVFKAPDAPMPAEGKSKFEAGTEIDSGKRRGAKSSPKAAHVRTSPLRGFFQAVSHRIRLFDIHDFIYTPGLPLSIVAGLLMVPHGVAVSLIVMAGEERGIDGMAVYFAAYAIAALGAKPLAGRIADLRGIAFVLVPALLIEVASTVLLAFMDSLVMVVVAAACMGIGQGSAYAATQAESVRGVEPSEMGRAANTFYLGPDIGMGFGPAFAGFVMQMLGVTAMFLSCGCLVLVALELFLLLRKQRKRKEMQYGMG